MNLKIWVGLEVIIKNDIPGKEKRCPCQIIGWDSDKLILLKINEITDQQLCTKGVPLTVGYLDEGVVFGFKSKILSVVELSESNYLMLQFPEQLETIQLRKERRLKVNFKGVYKTILEDGSIIDSQIMDCTIIDITANGCGMMTKYPQTSKKIALSFQVPLQGKIKDLRSIVVNETKLPNGESKFGIRFDEDSKQKSIIASYLSIIGIMHESSV
jgi:c-di-GMP-binding flagellar brake protein YcgR